MPSSNKIYLGIDPGTTRIGYGVIEDTGKTLRSLAWGVIENPGVDLLADKQSTRSELIKIIRKWKPLSIGVERLFFLNNKKTAMAVSEMRGVILLTIADQGVPLHEFTPLQVKQQVCGHGQAKKAQMQSMVRMLLRINEQIEPDDAADGLALAICCSTVQKFR